MKYTGGKIKTAFNDRFACNTIKIACTHQTLSISGFGIPNSSKQQQQFVKLIKNIADKFVFY